MNISRRFIDYPVMTTLLMAALVIFGAVGYISLPISDLPNIEFPTIVVSASLPGADPETMGSAIAAPLENQFANVSGITAMSSNSTQGMTQISIEFNLNKNIDSAAQDVQTAVSAALPHLPKTMLTPPTLRKDNPADLPIMFISMSSDTVRPSQVDEYAETLLARQISTLQGVSGVDVFGSTKYAVRVQADPDALTTRQIGIDTLEAAIAAANVDLATGALNGATRSSVIHANGQLLNAGAFERQIVTYRDGAPVRLNEVATVLDGIENPYAGSWYRNKPAVILAIRRQPGSNVIGVINSIRALLPQFQRTLPPSVNMDIAFARDQFIHASVNDVQLTLLIAGILVVGIIFAFLRQASATIIPSLALPIAVLGTFAGMAAFGYNLDNLSLMGLTLSVGFVVDDAIVMLENIVRHMEMGEEPYEAAIKGSAEIGFTILSMTLSLAAVFIPLVFMGGIVGRLLHEFAVTIILAILVSGIVSITLTPMLCARMLKSADGHIHGRLYQVSEKIFTTIHAWYERSLRWTMHRKPLVLAIFLLSMVASATLFLEMQQDFLPSDDTGRIQGVLQAANGTSYPQMVKYVEQVSRIINADPNVQGVMAQIGGGNGTAGVNSARLMTIALKPPAERSLSADQLIKKLRPKLTHFPGVAVFLTNPPTIRLGARQARSNYQYTLQGVDFDQLKDVSTRLVEALRNMPQFVDVNTDLDPAMPAVQVKINRDRAAALGVSPTQIENALGYAYNGQQVSQINAPSNQYEVILELLPKFQKDASTLSRLYITSNSGALVPLTAVTDITNGAVPLSVNHTGEIPSVTLSFDLAPGYALSDAVSGIQKASDMVGVPDTIQGNFQGTAAAFQSSMQNMGPLLFIAMIVVYIVLGILYESFIHPLTILSGLPSAAVGALFALYVAGMPLTLYAFVGMIMLIGIVKKNAIMMIDFALERQRRGDHVPADEAIFQAALVRFRPIMMTTMAALMSTLPVAFGAGMGADSRRPLGICVAGGLIFSQLLTLYITPVIYTYLDRIGGQFKGSPRVAALPAAE